MKKERFDLRDIILIIKKQKQIDAELSLEFDCYIETDDIKPLVKVINYAINYIRKLSDQSLYISLNAGMRGFTISLTAHTASQEFPAISPKVNEALRSYDAVLEQKSEPGKFVQLTIIFKKEIVTV